MLQRNLFPTNKDHEEHKFLPCRPSSAYLRLDPTKIRTEYLRWNQLSTRLRTQPCLLRADCHERLISEDIGVKKIRHTMDMKCHPCSAFDMASVELSQVYVPVANYCVQMMNTLNEFRKHNILCEVVIVVNGKQFFAHRSVLAASSPYFRAMFSSNMREQLENKPVVLENITADIMEELLHFIYTGSIKITPFNVKDFVSASNYLLMTSLKEACVSFMKTMLNPSNCLGIEAAAFKFDCTTLRKTANEYVFDHFLTVSQTDEFKLLSVERLTGLLVSDEIRVDREEQVFEALMRWLNHDVETRRTHFKHLSSQIRFPLMSPYYLADFVETEEIVLSTPECTALLLEAKNYHMLPDRRHLIKGSRTRPRRSMGLISVIFAAGGIQGSSVMKDTFCFVPAINRWSPLASMLTARCRHGLAVTGDMVYAVGGQSREGKFTRHKGWSTGGGVEKQPCLVWVEFVVGSRLVLRGFLLVLRFSSLHKTHSLLNSNSIWMWAAGLSVSTLLCVYPR